MSGDLNFKRIIIFGHTGFIGSQLNELFTSKPCGTEIIGKSLPELDLTDPRQVFSLSELFEGQTAIIICSAIKKQFGDNLDIFSQNLNMVINLCRLLKEQPVKRIVSFRSAEVYGDDIDNININEDTPVNPKTYYGAAKYVSECLLNKVVESHRATSLLILRPPLVYGPGDVSKGYGPAGFVWSAKNKQEITLWGDAEELRGFLFLDDLAKIVYRLTFDSYSGVVNVASGRNQSFKQALDIISGLVSFRLQVTSRPRTKPKVNQGFCNDRMMKLMPDISFTSLKDGIKRVFDEEPAENKAKAGII